MLSEIDLHKLAGKFIVVDGGDGCGKSTIVSRLEADLRGANVPVLQVREPGGTEYGEKIRDLLLHWKPESGERLLPIAEALLFSAARAQLFHTTIRPAIVQGVCVITDRFVSSTFAYQGSAGVPARSIAVITDTIIPLGEQPYLTVVVDVPHAEAVERMKASGSEPDRIESQGDIFHKNVRRAFRQMRFIMPNNYYVEVVDGSGTVDEVFGRVCKAISDNLVNRDV